MKVPLMTIMISIHSFNHLLIRKIMNGHKLPKRMMLLFSALGVMSLSLFFAFTNPADEGYKVGDVATDFSLKNAIDDQYVSLASYGDVKGYIVTFTCNTCPYAVMYEDRL